MGTSHEVELSGHRSSRSLVNPYPPIAGDTCENTWVWDESWNTGIDEIDQPRRRLHGLAEDLAGAIGRTNELATLTCVLQEIDTAAFVLRELAEYLPLQFETEERYMRTYEYPEYDRHHEEHLQALRRIRDLEARSKRCHRRFSLELADYAAEFWRTHVLDADLRLGEFLRARVVG